MDTPLGSTADAICAALRRLISSGEIADGSRLVERDLAERFSVSRIPLREALRRLEAEGLIEIHRNRGAIVRTLTPADIEEIYSLRKLLEGDAIVRSIARMDDETLARASVVHLLLAQARTPEKQDELNREFHALLYAPCGNARQLKAIEELRSQVERYERLRTTLVADTPAFQQEHEQILAACRARDARRARTATLVHLASAQRIVESVLAQTSRTR
jgi:DNA-binding GntR family transcriptional regulator